MSKILVVPDIHGRDFWKEPCREWKGKVVFLGDYHDPYPWEVTESQSIENLKEIINFYKENKNRVICLIGNHECNYLVNMFFSSRADFINKLEVTKLLKELDLKLIYQTDSILFSHAGVLSEWLELNHFTLDSLKNLSYLDDSLEDVSFYRGGCSKAGSLVWADIKEHKYQLHPQNIYQIFGHSAVEAPVINEYYACLDCKKCFIVDTKTKEIIPYDNMGIPIIS